MKRIVSPLSFAIGLALYGLSINGYAACSYDNTNGTLTLDGQACLIDTSLVTDSTQTLNITSSESNRQLQGQIRLNTDLTNTDTALLLDSTLGLRYTAQIGQSSAVNITSDNIAIQYNGTELRANSDGFNLLNGSTVTGGNYAFYIPNAMSNNLRITLTDGTINGNIYINDPSYQRNHQVLVPSSGTGTLRSSSIEGINQILVQGGNLTIASGSNGANWNSTEFRTQAGSTLTFLLENTAVDTIVTTAQATIDAGTTIIFALDSNINIADLSGKDIVLINTTTSLTNPVKSVAVYQNNIDITDSLEQAGAETQNPNEWLVTQQQAGSVTLSTTANQVIFNYTANPTVATVVDQSKANFLANTEYNQDYIGYLLDNSLGLVNSREALLINYPSNEEARLLSLQLTPDLSGADIRSAFLWGEQMRHHVSNRLLAYQHQLPIYEREEGWNLWASAAYGQGKDSDLYGYKLKRYGVHIGMDRQVNTEGLIGLSVGVNRNDINPTFSNIDKKMTQFLFMPYFEYNGDLYFAHANFLAGAYSVDSKRTIGNTTAEGDYTGFQFGYQVTGGVNTSFKGINFRPFVSVKEQWVQNEAWTEDGSPFALEVERQKYKARHIGGGFAIWKQIDLNIGKFVPSFEVEYYKQMGNRTFDPQYRLADDSVNSYQFYLNGITGNQFTTKLNASLNITEKLNISGALSYNKFGAYKESVIGLTVSNTF